MMISNKDLNIETLRGFAIFLVVIGHVIGSAPDGGMRIDFPSPWRYLYLWIDYIQMPLFTAIAGWAYALNGSKKTNTITFIVKKFQRLIIPMSVAATIYFLIQYVTPGTNYKKELSDIWRIYLYPYTFYWYLQSLFLIFIFITIVEKIIKVDFRSWILILVCSYLLYLFQINILSDNSSNYFSYKGAIEQLPFFIIGIGVNRYRSILMEKPFIMGALIIVGLVLLQMKWFFRESISFSQLLIYKSLLPIWLIPTLVFILSRRVSVGLFVFLGSYAYSIYLYHGFGTSGGRILLSYFGVNNQIVVFIVATLIALTAPVIFDKLISRNRFLRFVFLGKIK